MDTPNLTSLRRNLENLGHRLRVMPGAPNVFGTEASFGPEIGRHWAPGERPRGYYIDFRRKPTEAAWPPAWFQPREEQLGVAYAQWGLGAYERHLDGEGEKWLAAALQAADYVAATLQSGGRLDGAWLHLMRMPHTFRLEPPWVSAMAQGECASLLVRAHLETGEERYADAARRALKTIRLPVADGGTLAEVDGHPVLEEYPTAIPSAVLNGAIFAMWGVYDVGQGLGDATASALFEQVTDGLAALIGRYDTGYWSKYDLYPHPRPNIASAAYHLLHIRQLNALQRLSPRPELPPVIERFERYRESAANRRKAFAEKVAFRIVVPRNPVFAHRLPWAHAADDQDAAVGAGRGGSDDALALCYHAVSETWPADLSIQPGLLREQLLHLREKGYRGVTFGELVSGQTAGKVVAVTFDDGYRSVLRLAQPILAELGFTGTLFVPTDWIGADRPMQWPGIDQWMGGPHEEELLPMSWDEVRRLRDLGWEIGSHTCSHPRLSHLPAAELATELGESRSRCAAELGACATIAYPYGDHDEAVVSATAAAGYRAAATLPADAPSPRPFAWPRIGIYNNDDMRAFRLKVSPLVRCARGSAAWPAVAGTVRSLKRKMAT